MRFSIVRTDSKRQVRLQVRPAGWFLERIRTDTKAGDIVRVREHIADFGDDEDADWQKGIARICPSVELERTENGNLRITAFNGLVTLHVSGLLRQEDIRAVKEAVRMLPMTFAAFTGTDGRSVEILVAVARQGGAPSLEEAELDGFCLTAYETALGIYNSILPREVERQRVSARSSFRMTLDESPYYNPSPVPLTVQTEPGRRVSADKQTGTEIREVDMTLYGEYEKMYMRAAEEAYEETADVIDAQFWQAYITELARRLCIMGMPEEEAFLHIRNHHVYKHIYDEDTFRTIVAAVWQEERPERRREGETTSRATKRLIKFLTTRYVFRYNTVMGYTEYRPNSTWLPDWQPCDENAVNAMTIEARLADIDARDKDVRRYVRSGMIRQSDPVTDWFSKVHDKWDGRTDHIALLARTVRCDVPQWERWFRKWFLSMVAQWIRPVQEYGNSVVPLLISPQGDGKTTFCRNLLPRELRWGFLENLDVSEKRQTLQAMHGFLLINLDEFNQISPKLQAGYLKNVIQLPSVKIKRPYGRHVEEFRRYASFIATTNEVSVLSDPTGSRRFICVRLTAPIDTGYEPNYEALYAQAYQLIMNGREQYWFTPDEVQEIMAHNRQYEMQPAAVQYFNEYYEAAKDETEGRWQSATAIFDRLRHIAGSGLKAGGVATFGRYLRNIPGLRQKRITSGVVYLVKERK